MLLRALAPEASVSANFTTWANALAQYQAIRGLPIPCLPAGRRHARLVQFLLEFLYHQDRCWIRVFKDCQVVGGPIG